MAAPPASPSSGSQDSQGPPPDSGGPPSGPHGGPPEGPAGSQGPQGAPASSAYPPSGSGRLLPLGAPIGSSVSHRLADFGRSFLARFSSAPQTSQFVDKGTLTPQEFLDAGDLLVFKFPTWQWEAAVGKRVNSWLPPDKQFLVTRGVACHRRVRDIEASLSANAKEDAEGWVLPVDEEQETPQEPQSLPSVGAPSKNRAETSAAGGASAPSNDAGGGALPELKNLRDLDSLLCEDDPACADSSSSYFVRQAPDADVMSVRTYDLSITYDKYFQTPRLWLFGYNEHGIPLSPAEIFEDILTDYAAKTVTVDPHPCTGIPTASIHPCKHAQVMKKVVDHWRAQGVEPRPDLALIVLLKFISSVIPTIDYDFTMDIDMGLCGPTSDKSN